MSNVVDNRIVEMQFNNAQFERGISQTTSSLDKLKEALNFKKQTDGFDNINSAARRVDLGFLERRFNTFGIVSMTAIQNITNRLIDLGFKIKSTFTSGLIKGGITRALNIEQAKFQIEGLKGVWDKTSKGYKEGMETIRDATLDAVKGTAYGLDEAAKVGSQLLASGIKDTDALEKHMRAVAGVAAMTGGSYSEIGRIFTQTAGQGAMMGEQLMELSARGLNAAATLSEYFSRHKKEWEEAKKVLTDKDIEKLGGKLSKPTEAAIREIASKRGITFDMFSKAFDEAFGAHAKDANKTFTGAMSNMKAALSRIGADVASESLTHLRDVMNSLTTVIDGVHDALGPTIEQINNLQKAVTGKVVTALKDFGNQITAFSKSYSRFYSFSDSFKSVITIFQALKTVAIGFGKSLLVVYEFFKPIAKVLLEIAGRIGAYINFVGHVADSSKIFQKASATAGEWGNKIAGLLRVIADGVGPTIKKLLSIVPTIGNIFSNSLGKAIDIGVSFGQFLTGVFRGLAEGIPEVIKYLAKAFESFSNSVNGIARDGSRLADLFSSTGILIIVNNLTGIAQALKEPGKFLDNFFETLTHSAGPFKNAMWQVKNSLLQFQGALKAQIIEKIAISVGILAGSLFLLSSIPADKLALALGGLAGVTFIFGGLLKSLSAIELFSKANIFQTAEITALAFSIENFAIAILILVAGVKLLSGIETDDLARGLIGIAVLMGAIVTMANLLPSKRPGKMMSGIGDVYTLALAVSMLAKAVKKISDLGPEQLATGLAGVGSLLLALAGLSHIMGSVKITTGIAMVGIAESINLLVKSVSVFGKLDTNKLVNGVGAVAAIMFAIAGMSKLMGSGGGVLLASAGMLIMAEAMKQLVETVKEFGSMNADQLAQGMEVLVGSMMSLALVGQLANGTLKGAVSIAILSKSVETFAGALKTISNIPFEYLIASIGALAIGFGAVGGVAALLGAFAAGPLVTFAGAIALLGTGLFLAGLGVSTFAAGLATLATMGTGAISILGSVIDEFISRIPEMGSALGSGIVAIIVSIMQEMTKLVDAGVEIVTAILMGIGDNIYRFAVIGGDIIMKFLAGVGKNIYKVASVAVEVLMKFIHAIADHSDQIADTGVTLIVKLINGMANALRNHSEEIISAFMNLWEAIWEFTIDSLQALVELIPGIGPKISSALEVVKENFRNTLKPEDSKKIGQEHMKGYGEGAESEQKNVKKQTQKVAKSAREGLGGTNAFNRTGRGHSSGYGSGFGSGRKGVSTQVASVRNAAVKELGKNKEFGKQGKDSGTKYTSGMGSKKRDARTEATKLKNEAKSGVSGAEKEFRTQGSNAGSGFVAGIKAWLRRAFGAGESLSSEGVKGAKAGQKSNSPAKELIKEGKNAVAGYVVGVRQNKSKSYLAMKSMVEATVDVAATSIKRMQSLMDDGIDIAPSIAPVLDTSDVERGLSYIDSAFASNGRNLRFATDIDAGVSKQIAKDIEFNNSFDKLAKKIDRATDTMNNRELNTYITVNGSDNPEEFADRFIRDLKLRMRTG